MTADDRVVLRGLRGFGRHGLFDREREQGQEFVVDVELVVDTSPAAASDDLADTVDYGALATDVVAVVEGEPVRLVETLAQRIADVCLRRDLVDAVTVTVHKPQAPVQVPVADVAVTIHRRRA